MVYNYFLFSFILIIIEYLDYSYHICIIINILNFSTLNNDKLIILIILCN